MNLGYTVREIVERRIRSLAIRTALLAGAFFLVGLSISLLAVSLVSLLEHRLGLAPALGVVSGGTLVLALLIVAAATRGRSIRRGASHRANARIRESPTENISDDLAEITRQHPVGVMTAAFAVGIDLASKPEGVRTFIDIISQTRAQSGHGQK